MSDCTCDGWKDNIEKVNGPIVLQSIRSGNLNQYDGKPFTYCPWCGSSLGLKRKFSIVVHAGGDTLRDLFGLLDEYRSDADLGSRQMVSGGCGAGGYFVLTQDDSMTHEKYVEALEQRNKS